MFEEFADDDLSPCRFLASLSPMRCKIWLGKPDLRNPIEMSDITDTFGVWLQDFRRHDREGRKRSGLGHTGAGWFAAFLRG